MGRRGFVHQSLGEFDSRNSFSGSCFIFVIDNRPRDRKSNLFVHCLGTKRTGAKFYLEPLSGCRALL
jgi:hypothetical protein